MANNRQRLSFFAEMRRNNNPRFYDTMSTDDLRRSVKRIVTDLKYNNIAEEDYVYFDNNTLFNICIDESERQYKNASVLLNAMNYYINCGLRAGYVPYPTIEYVEEYRNANTWKNFNNIVEGDWTIISLNKNETVLYLNESETLSATFLPDTTSYKILLWQSSDSTIATVDQNGMVTALAVGNATITATTTDGYNLSDSCMVEV